MENHINIRPRGRGVGVSKTILESYSVLIFSLSHSLSEFLTLSLFLILPLSLTRYSLTLSPTLTLILSQSPSLSFTLSVSLSHSLSFSPTFACPDLKLNACLQYIIYITFFLFLRSQYKQLRGEHRAIDKFYNCHFMQESFHHFFFTSHRGAFHIMLLCFPHINLDD